MGERVGEMIALGLTPPGLSATGRDRRGLGRTTVHLALPLRHSLLSAFTLPCLGCIEPSQLACRGRAHRGRARPRTRVGMYTGVRVSRPLCEMIIVHPASVVRVCRVVLPGSAGPGPGDEGRRSLPAHQGRPAGVGPMPPDEHYCGSQAGTSSPHTYPQKGGLVRLAPGRKSI